MSEHRNAVIEAESHEFDAGLTLGAVNRHEHDAVIANARNPAIEKLESNHLMYERGRGVRKVEERDCLSCLDTGLDDGKWHQV